MISTEIVQSVENGRIITNKGVRRAAGNALIRVGSAVTVMGDMVIGWRRRAGYVPGAPPQETYRLASSDLTMYIVNSAFEIIRTETIIPPVDGAQLLAHTYNERAEYLIWFVDSRCIIQKDGETIADFVSVFAEKPFESDGYVDDDGRLIWGASIIDYDTVFIASYNNNVLAGQKTILRTEVEAAYRARMEQIANTATVSTTVTPGQTYTEVFPFVSIDVFPSVLHHAEYIGVTLESDYIRASKGQCEVVDYFNSGGLSSASSYATIYANVNMYQYWQNNDGSYTDHSYSSILVASHLRNAVIYDIANGAVVEEMQVHEDASYASDSETLYSHIEVDSIGAPEPTTAVVISVQGHANTESGFAVGPQDFESQYFLFYGTTDVPVTVTALTGENAGQSRTGWITSVFTHQSPVQPVWFDFATAWDNVPVDGDTYTFNIRRGFITDTYTMGSIAATVYVPEIQNITEPKIVAPIGNEYAIQKGLKMENVYGWVSPSRWLLYGGQECVELNPYSNSGAWYTAPASLTGLADGQAIKADGANVSTSETQLYSILTKRFTGVTI